MEHETDSVLSVREESRQASFVGNNSDLAALIAVTLAITAVASCLTFGNAVYCLPFAALILGIIALAGARSSIKPDRTRLLGWLSVGLGGAMLLLVLLFCVCIILFYGAAFASALNNTPIPRR